LGEAVWTRANGHPQARKATETSTQEEYDSDPPATMSITVTDE